MIVEIPIVPNGHIKTLSGLRGNTFSLSYSDNSFQWNIGKISATIETKGYGFQHDENQIAREVEQALGRMRETIKFKNDAIKSENSNLLTVIDRTIRDRLSKISENKEKLSALTTKISIPLKKKPGVRAQAIKLSEKPILRRVKPKPSLPEELVLDESRVKDIITFLERTREEF